MEKLRKRSEVNKEDCWDLTLMVKDQAEYEEKKNLILQYNQKIVAMKGHILDSKDTLKEFLGVSERESRLLEQLYIYVRLTYDEDTSNATSLTRKLEMEQLIHTCEDSE